MQGILYLCGTPIGNLEDITLRALRILKEVDLIAAEDTRTSLKLLNHYEIKTPLTSYHEFNKIEKAEKLIEKLKNGTNIALITDAGTPGISDPGEELVKKCYGEGIEVTSLPGACACINALILSGLSTRRFCFEAFLPKEKKKRGEVLQELLEETRTIMIYEAPHHLVTTLEELKTVLGNRNITLVREITKRYEAVMQTTFDAALLHYSGQQPKGEFVIVIEGRDREEIKQEEQMEWCALSLEEHMGYYESQGIIRKEAMRQVAKDRGISKREVYQQLLDR